MIATAATPTTMDELLESLGGISPKRVLLSPAPGTATGAPTTMAGVLLPSR